MLSVMCPNCRHRFPAPGCCNPGVQSATFVVPNNRSRRDDEAATAMKTTEGAFYGGGYLLVPRDYDNTGGGCFINAPTIINGPTIIQQPAILEKLTTDQSSTVATAPSSVNWLKALASERHQRRHAVAPIDDSTTNDGKVTSARDNIIGNCHIDTSCELTGGTVTITAPGIQSGGCLIRANDTTDILVQSPRIEIRPKVTLIGGGGCFVKRHHPVTRSDEASSGCSEDEDEAYHEYCEDDFPPPSGCQELPGSRRSSSTSKHHHHHHQHRSVDPPLMSRNNELNARNNASTNSTSDTKKRHSSCCCANRHRDRLETHEPPSRNLHHHHHHHHHHHQRPRNENPQATKKSPTNVTSGPMEIRVNATVQLPPTVAHCTVNITATAATPNPHAANDNSGIVVAGRRDNFNGGGLVQFDADACNEANDAISNERREEAPPTTPLSWLMPCPWGFDNYSMDRDATRLTEIKRLLQTSGWYHEGLSWQQSESLLANASLGSWLVRDSSDSRFVFAVSVQTARGPTSVRVHYFLGRFRLDAEPRMSLAMPMFECPIKMLQHYVDYSKRLDEHRKEVWVDYSGQLYSQIYLTKPLVKEVRTLSHLARIAVNSNKLNVDYLPPLMKHYLAEYPYSL